MMRMCADGQMLERVDALGVGERHAVVVVLAALAETDEGTERKRETGREGECERKAQDAAEGVVLSTNAAPDGLVKIWSGSRVVGPAAEQGLKGVVDWFWHGECYDDQWVSPLRFFELFGPT